MGQRFSNHLAPIFRDLQGPDASSMTDALPPPMPEVGPSRGRPMRNFGRVAGGWRRGALPPRPTDLAAGGRGLQGPDHAELWALFRRLVARDDSPAGLDAHRGA